jgi:4-amino-4-deoxy-L-arabinose transferase-like glycosyltransferase
VLPDAQESETNEDSQRASTPAFTSALPTWLQPLAAKLSPATLALASCGFALLMGLAFLPVPGLQYDEILFLHPYLYQWSLFRTRIEGVDIPLMVMSYVGALKTWLFWPVYHWLPASVWAVRLPMLLLACVNFWMLYRLGNRMVAPAAGVVAIALAVTDPTLLLTQLFDWGPVTLQIFLSLSAALLFLAWRETGKPSRLAFCGLCCGLALWNKAIFVWLLFAVVAAAVICWPAMLHPLRLWQAIRQYWHVWLLAALCFGLGAAPFLAYNLTQEASTVTQNARFEDHFPVYKLSAMAGSLDGRYIAGNTGFSSATPAACTDGSLHQSEATAALPPALQAMPAGTATPLLLVACLAALLWHWRSHPARAGLFLLLVFTIHSGLAIMSVNGGTGLHHYAPVLPAVFLAMGIAWSLLWSRLPNRKGSAARWLKPALLLLAILAPLQAAITMTAWHQRASQCGGQQLWTHATKALAHHVLAHPDQRFHVTDWGIDPQAIYFSRKREAIGFLGILNEEVATEGPHHDEAARIFADPATRLVSFPPGKEVIPQHTERLEALLALHGYTREQRAVIYDSDGKVMYVVSQVVPKSEDKTASNARQTD